VNRKYALIAILMAAILGGGYWYYMVTSFESSVGTNNSYVVHDNEDTLSNGTNDSLLSLEFESGTDNLEWSFTTIMLDDGQSQFDCTLGGLSSKTQANGKVQTNLNADGRTFTVSIDATSEETYTGFSLFSMSESTNENYSLRFSKTDIYFGEGISWLKVDDTDFNQLTALPSDNFSTDTSERLDWYDYDLSVHRVEPKDRIFLLNDGEFTYKVQFINYYNANDESRHVTMIVSWFGNQSIPAINNPDLVQASPCIIIDNDDYWSFNETIQIQENGIDICQTTCRLDITIVYNNIEVKGAESIQLN